MDEYASGIIDGRAATVMVIRNLHNQETWIDGTGVVCGLCRTETGALHPWPCPTIKALNRWVERPVREVRI